VAEVKKLARDLIQSIKSKLSKSLIHMGSISSTFYEQLLRAQIPKKDWQLDCIFALLGSARVKDAGKTLIKLTHGIINALITDCWIYGIQWNCNVSHHLRRRVQKCPGRRLNRITLWRLEQLSIFPSLCWICFSWDIEKWYNGRQAPTCMREQRNCHNQFDKEEHCVKNRAKQISPPPSPLIA